MVKVDEKVKELEAEQDVSRQKVAHLEACTRREALLQYLEGLNAMLAQALLFCLGVDLIGYDFSKEVVGGRLVDLGSANSVIEGKALEGMQETTG